MSDDEIAGLFHKVRNAIPVAMQGCREILAQLDRYRTSHRGSVAALRPSSMVSSAKLDRIESIDYLEAPRASAPRALWGRRPAPPAAETRPAQPVDAIARRCRTGSTW